MEVKSGIYKDISARLNRVVDAQRDQNIINSVVQALGNKTA